MSLNEMSDWTRRKNKEQSTPTTVPSGVDVELKTELQYNSFRRMEDARKENISWKIGVSIIIVSIIICIGTITSVAILQ
tara:strand:- start:586 stop:822 length:237 start_codon:yes stop_codon:yes gene_type:complete